MVETVPGYVAGGGSAWIVSDDRAALNAVIGACMRRTGTSADGVEAVAVEQPPEVVRIPGVPDPPGPGEPPATEHPAGFIGREKPVTLAYVAARGERAPLPVVRTAIAGRAGDLTVPGGSVHVTLPCGKGRLVITTVPALFSNEELGVTTDIPTRERYAVLRLVWDTIDACLAAGR
jgi:hypothetical protein